MILWTFWDRFWTFLDGLSLECLWTARNGFQRELDWISAAMCVCVGRSRKPWPLERWKSSTGSYSLYIHWVFYLVFFQLAALRDVAKAAIQLQEIQVQL